MRRATRAADVADAEALTARTYARTAHYREDWHRDLGLFDFEEAALADFFPAPPASILVHGAGGGREVAALLERGYRVTAADPVPGLVESAMRAFGDRAVFVGAGLVSDEAPPELAGPFDGVVVGWGAFGHLLTAELRVEALRRLRAACPDGPVLVSWTYAPSKGLRGTARTTGEVRELARGGPAAPGTWRDRLLLTQYGLYHVRLDEESVRAEAREAGYGEVVYRSPDEHGYPFAVLLPPAAAAEAPE